MSSDPQIKNLEQLLDRICEAPDEHDRVTLGAILDTAGRRSFGPLLLVAGLVTLAPIVGDIPGVPTIMAVLVFLTAVQLLFRREYFWLPGWLLDRSVSRDKLRKTVNWLRRPARFIDQFIRPRLTTFMQRIGAYVVAIACIVISIAMPPMEVIPFSANIAGAALTAFGLSLIAQDGLVALIAVAFTALMFGILAYNLL